MASNYRRTNKKLGKEAHRRKCDRQCKWDRQLTCEPLLIRVQFSFDEWWAYLLQQMWLSSMKFFQSIVSGKFSKQE